MHDNEEKKSKKTAAPRKAFIIALTLSTIVCLFTAFLVFYVIPSNDSAILTSTLTAAFTCISVIWAASGIYLSQLHLEKYSEELKDHRKELSKHTRAFEDVNSSLSANSFVTLYKIATLQMDSIEEGIIGYLNGAGRGIVSAPLHKTTGMPDILARVILPRSGYDKALLLKQYCVIYEKLEGQVKDHPQKDILHAIFFHNSDIARNSTLFSDVLRRQKER